VARDELNRGAPRTYVGRWVLATLLGRRAERDRRVKTLNGGREGWNEDEPAVVAAVSELAMRRYFPDGAVPADITGFVSRLVPLVRSIAVPPQEEVEDLVRQALGQPDATAAGISNQTKMIWRLNITVRVVQLMALGEREVASLIAGAEQTAFARGFHPPLAAEP
jgi:hypothetical protein